MKLNDKLFNINIDGDNADRVVVPGSVLVAEPLLSEPYFNHSSILVVDGSRHSETMGVVLNNPSGSNLQALIEGVTLEEPVQVFCGGPLGLDRLYSLHTLGDVIDGSQEIGDSGVFIGGDFEAIVNYVNSGYPLEGNVRFFVGYSSWSAGQLGDEIDKHVWVVSSVEATGGAQMQLTGSGNSYWHRVIDALGDDYRIWRMFPKNPAQN